MANPTIRQITLPSGTVYDIEDSVARAAAAGINMVKCTSASDTPIGVTWDDDGTTITGTLVASDQTTGKFYLVPVETPKGNNIFDEYITVVESVTYSWEKIGSTEVDLSMLGDLAYQDTASGNFTPAGTIAVNASSGTGTSFTPEGTVSQPTFSGSAMSSTGDFTPEGTIQVNAASGSGTSYTPEGSVSAPTISVSSAGSTASVTPFGSAGTLPALSMTVTDGNLSIGFDQGTLPAAGTAVTVKTGDASYEATAPSFTGTEKKLAFSGTQGNISVSGTPSGTVSQPSFSGTEKKLAFSGTQGQVTVS